MSEFEYISKWVAECGRYNDPDFVYEGFQRLRNCSKEELMKRYGLFATQADFIPRIIHALEEFYCADGYEKEEWGYTLEDYAKEFRELNAPDIP